MSRPERNETRASWWRSSVASAWATGAIVVATQLASPLAAQVRQYTPPGGAADETEGRREALAGAVEDSRWHAGPVRLDPAFWISDLSWVDRQQSAGTDAGSDLTGRVGAGLRAYLPVGSKTTVAAYALPEYVWWQDRTEDRRINQRFGVGSFTYFNRLAIAVTAKRDEDFGFATGEVLQRYTSRTEELAIDLEVPIVRRLAIYAHGSDSSARSLVDDSDPVLAEFFAGLDRDDLAYRGGVRYYPTAELRLGGGVGHSESDFAPGALDRSNAGDFWYAEVGYNRPKLSMDLQYQANQLAAVDGSGFSDFDQSTGSARIEWRPREKFGARVYGARQLAYSLLVADASGYVDELIGAGVNLSLGWRLRLDLYAETGTHSYQSASSAAAAAGERVDDVDSYGVELRVELMRQLSLRVGYEESKIVPESGSGLGGQKISQILANLSFGFDQGTWY